MKETIYREDILNHLFLCVNETEHDTPIVDATLLAVADYIRHVPAVESIRESVESNPYWERVCEIADRQRAKGKDKYGYGLEDNPAEMAARIRHLEEELIDGLMYCEWIKEKLDNIETMLYKKEQSDDEGDADDR